MLIMKKDNGKKCTLNVKKNGLFKKNECMRGLGWYIYSTNSHLVNNNNSVLIFNIYHLHCEHK